jgi:hypothetical protein
MVTKEIALLLRHTRRTTVFAAAFLSLQLFGNLYEEVVTNPRMIVMPHPGEGVLAVGSPLYYYLPWAPLGVILTVVLAFRLASAPPWVRRRMRWAVACLAVAVATKAYLITWINPRFRNPVEAPQLLRSLAIEWELLNGIAIVAVAAALWMILAWRAKLLDLATLSDG